MIADPGFADHAKDPHTWLALAHQLEYASEALFSQLLEENPDHPDFALHGEVGVFKGFLLLRAFAIENALKAVRVAQLPPKVAGGVLSAKDLGGGKSGHDLLLLAKENGITLSSEEHALLERMNVFSLWGGRYPVPLKESQYKYSIEKGLRHSRHPEDEEHARTLIKRAESAVLAATQGPGG